MTILLDQVCRVIAGGVLNRVGVIAAGRIGVAHRDRLQRSAPRRQQQHDRAAADRDQPRRSKPTSPSTLTEKSLVAGPASSSSTSSKTSVMLEPIAGHRRPLKSGRAVSGASAEVFWTDWSDQRGRVVARAVLNRVVVIARGGIEVAHHH